MPWQFASPPHVLTASDKVRISVLGSHGLMLQTLMEGELSPAVTGFPPVAKGCARPSSACGL